MTETGNAFSVDLHNLWQVAVSDLPEIAQRFAGANQVLASASNDQASFAETSTRRIPEVGHTSQVTVSSPVYAYWDALRDEFQNILAETTNNMYDCAQGIHEIMKNYAATDEAARQQLEAMQASDLTRRTGRKYHDISIEPKVSRAS